MRGSRHLATAHMLRTKRQRATAGGSPQLAPQSQSWVGVDEGWRSVAAYVCMAAAFS